MLRWLRTLWQRHTRSQPRKRKRAPQPAPTTLPLCIIVRVTPTPLIVTRYSDPDLFAALHYLAQHPSGVGLSARDLAATLGISRLAADYARRWWHHRQRADTAPDDVPF